jgi:predicted PurR-regulated permease PerM
MKSQGINATYFIVSILVVLSIALYVLWPFVGVMAIAAVLAVVLGPVYRFILVKVKGYKTVASSLTLILFLFAVILPLIFVVQNIFVETSNFYVSLSNRSVVSFEKINSSVELYVQRIFPQFTFDAREKLGEASLYIINNLGGFFAGTVSIGAKLFLTMFAMFYFLRDGEKFKDHILDLSPIPRADGEKVVTSLKSSINSIVVGTVTVAALQAIVIAIGCLIFGVPNPALCAVLVALVALFPGVGPSIVWIPATIYLFFFGGNFPYAWIGFMIYCPVLFTYNDTFLGPKMIHRGSNIHPLLILFSILGGIIAFGPEGIILGPVVLAFLFTLIRVYQDYANERAVQA